MRAATPIAWPSVGSAAMVIPALGVQRTWHDHVVPIASLTKMMTAYVMLKKLPLLIGETGPCVTVNAADVPTTTPLTATDQSSAAVAVGRAPVRESACSTGLLVHSASNYADDARRHGRGVAPTSFVAHMNADALTSRSAPAPTTPTCRVSTQVRCPRRSTREVWLRRSDEIRRSCARSWTSRA